MRFQQLGTVVQDGIKKLKLESRKEYQELAVEEHGLSSELEMLAEKYDALLIEEKESHTVSAPRPRVVSAKQRATSAAASRRLSGAPKPPSNPELTVLKAEIDSMDDQLFSLGGFNLGWRACDHQDFLRLYTKYGHYRVTSLSFLNEVLSVVPAQDVDSVKEHLGKYEDQQRLNEEKKEKIKEYKLLLKESKAKSKVSQAPKAPVAPKRASSRSALNRAKQKEEITQWKKDKENEEVNKKAEIEKQKKERIARKKDRAEQERQMKAQQALEYRMKKQIQKE